MLQIKILINILLFYKDFKECKFWQWPWGKMDFYSILWKAECCSPLTAADGPFIWRILGQICNGGKVYKPSCRVSKTILQNATPVQSMFTKNNSKCSCMQFFYFAPYKNYKILFQTKLGCSGKGIYEAHGGSGRQTKRDST